MSGIWAKYNLRLAEKPLQTKTLTVRLLLSLFFSFFFCPPGVHTQFCTTVAVFRAAVAVSTEGLCRL